MSLADRKLPSRCPDRLAPQRCALMIVDMQNDFCAPGGYIDQTMKMDVSAGAQVAPKIDELVAAARKAGVPVVWLRADYSHDRIPDSMAVKLLARGIQAECCKPGTWGHEFYQLQPQPGEPIVTKHTYSGFTGTNMKDVLAGLGRSTVVFTGVQTQICVESTLRDAHAHGYMCVAVQDAVGSHTAALHQATLTNVKFLFGDVCDTSDVLAAWR